MTAQKKKKSTRSAPSKKPFRLEVGKTYETASGRRVKLDRADEFGDFFGRARRCHEGVWSPDGAVWAHGGYTSDTYGAIIREVQPPKSPKGRGK